MAKYRVTYHGIQQSKGRRFIPVGETVELDSKQAEAFADRIEKVQEQQQTSTSNRSAKPGLYVHHRGGGTYDVYRQDTNERVNSAGMTKEQAQEMAGNG